MAKYSFGLQLAVASGATVIATSSSDAKLAIAKKLGATYTINYNTTPDWDKEVLKLTDGRGVDHILEVRILSSFPDLLLEFAGRRTRYPREIDFGCTVCRVHPYDWFCGPEPVCSDGFHRSMHEKDNISARHCNWICRTVSFLSFSSPSSADVEENFRFKSMNRLLQAHPESTRPVIDKVFSFEEAIDAYTHLESQKHVGKVVIRVVPA